MYSNTIHRHYEYPTAHNQDASKENQFNTQKSKLARTAAFYNQTTHRFTSPLTPIEATGHSEAADIKPASNASAQKQRVCEAQCPRQALGTPKSVDVLEFNHLLNVVKRDIQDGESQKYHLARQCAGLFGVELYAEEKMASPGNRKIVNQQLSRKINLNQCYLAPHLRQLSEGGISDVLTLLKYARDYLNQP